MSKTKFNRQKFLKDIDQQFTRSMQSVAEQMQTYITEEKRDYPNITIRRVGAGVTGKVAGSPRDVVDKGDLRDSFEITVEEEGKKAIVTARWSAEHGKYIYFGTDKQPPYPWVTIALRRIDLIAEFKKHGTTH